MGQEKVKGKRIGSKSKYADYKASGIRAKNSAKKQKKFARNRERWANDETYQARQLTRKSRLLKTTEAT